MAGFVDPGPGLALLMASIVQNHTARENQALKEQVAQLQSALAAETAKNAVPIAAAARAAAAAPPVAAPAAAGGRGGAKQQKRKQAQADSDYEDEGQASDQENESGKTADGREQEAAVWVCLSKAAACGAPPADHACSCCWTFAALPADYSPGATKRRAGGSGAVLDRAAAAAARTAAAADKRQRRRPGRMPSCF
jgi:hypothetical protein